MKTIDLNRISIGLSIIVLVAIVYYNIRLKYKIEEIEPFDNIITLYTYGNIVQAVLLSLAAIGFIAGLMSAIKNKKIKLGAILCALELLILIFNQ